MATRVSFFHHGIGILVQQIENLVVKDICHSFDGARIKIGIIAKAHAHRQQG